MDYIKARDKFINEKDEDFDRESTKRYNKRLWDEWERQIRKNERDKIFSNLADNIVKELGDDTIELIKVLQERFY